MTIKELKQHLEKYDDNTMVVIPAQYGGFHEMNTVEQREVREDENRCESGREGRWTDFALWGADTKQAICLLSMVIAIDSFSLEIKYD